MSLLLLFTNGGPGDPTISPNGFSIPVTFGTPTVTVATNNALRISGEQDVPQVQTRSGRFPVTFVGWFYAVSNRSGAYMGLFSLEEGPGHSTSYNEIGIEGTSFAVYDQTTGLLSSFGSVSTGVYYKVAFVIENGTFKAYTGVQGTAGVTLGANGSIANLPTSNDYQGIGGTQFTSTEWFDGRVAGVRIWNAALSEAEIEAEFTSATPVRSTDLLGAWFPPSMSAASPLAAISGADLIDGNGGGAPDYTTEFGPALDPSTGSTISPIGFSIPVTFGSPTVQPGSVNVSPTGISIPLTAGTPTITARVTISPNGFSIPVTFGSPTVQPGSVSVSPNGFSIPVTFGSPAVQPGSVSVSPNGFSIPVSFGSPTVSQPIVISPNGFSIPVSFGSPAVQLGSVNIAPNGLSIPVSFGSPTATATATISPTGVSIPRTLGTPTITASATISPTGISIPRTLGAPTVSAIATISPNGLSIPVTFGSPAVAPGSVNITPNGLSIPVSFGTPTVSDNVVPSSTVNALGFTIPANLGRPTITPGPVNIAPNGLSISVSFGTPTATAITTVSPLGLSIPITLGVPGLVFNQIVSPNGIRIPLTFGSLVIADRSNSRVVYRGPPLGFPSGSSRGALGFTPKRGKWT